MNFNGGSDFQYNVNIIYPMDYLFGGTINYISRLAAKTAAANSSIVVYESTKAQLSALQAAGLPLPSGRKKRLVVLVITCFVFSVSIEVDESMPKSPRFSNLGSNDNQEYKKYKSILVSLASQLIS